MSNNSIFWKYSSNRYNHHKPSRIKIKSNNPLEYISFNKNKYKNLQKKKNYSFIRNNNINFNMSFTHESKQSNDGYYSKLTLDDILGNISVDIKEYMILIYLELRDEIYEVNISKFINTILDNSDISSFFIPQSTNRNINNEYDSILKDLENLDIKNNNYSLNNNEKYQKFRNYLKYIKHQYPTNRYINQSQLENIIFYNNNNNPIQQNQLNNNMKSELKVKNEDNFNNKDNKIDEKYDNNEDDNIIEDDYEIYSESSNYETADEYDDEDDDDEDDIGYSKENAIELIDSDDDNDNDNNNDNKNNNNIFTTNNNTISKSKLLNNIYYNYLNKIRNDIPNNLDYLKNNNHLKYNNLQNRNEYMRKFYDDEINKIKNLSISDNKHDNIEKRIKEKEDNNNNFLNYQLKPLNDEENNLIQNIWESGMDNDILITKFNIYIKREYIRRLEPYIWLNDEIINFYLNLLQEEDNNICEKLNNDNYNRKNLKCNINYFNGNSDNNDDINMPINYRPSHYFNSFFYNTLLDDGIGYNYNRVRRWTKKFDFFAMKNVYIPINNGSHWTLCVIFVQEKKIRYYDSLGGNGSIYMNNIKKYIFDEMKKKNNIEIDMNEWELIGTTNDIPRQDNSDDCGVFTIMFADFISHNTEMKFSCNDMILLRKKIALRILSGSLLKD